METTEVTQSAPVLKVRYATTYNANNEVTGYLVIGTKQTEKTSENVDVALFFCSGKDFFHKQRAYKQVLSALKEGRAHSHEHVFQTTVKFTKPGHWHDEHHVAVLKESLNHDGLKRTGWFDRAVSRDRFTFGLPGGKKVDLKKTAK